MSIEKMSKEDLELLSNKEITYIILEESKKSINTADLFKKIVKLLELPDSYFDTKIADYYTALATDKRFVLLNDGTWDLKNRYKSDEIKKHTEEDEYDEEDDQDDEKELVEDDIEEDNYDDQDTEYDEDANEELKDLVVIDEDELELEG